LSVTITQPTAGLSLTEMHTNVLCFGASTASIDQTVTGGTAPYTYLWSNNGTSEDIANLASGTYSVTTTDASGCTATLSVIITQPAAGINLSETHTNVLCFGNATAGINQTVTGGTAPYTYLWSNNATTEDLTNIVSGTYTVTTNDAVGCTATLSVTITQPAAAISMSSTILNVLCVNGTGSVDLTVSGGTPNYTYLWSNNATTQDLLAVISGLYTVTVTDANGCTATFNSTVAQAVSSTPVQINNQTGTNILSCLTTAIVLQGTGGTNYTWNAGSTPNSATNTFIAPGTYTLSTFDSNNCPVSVSVVISQNIILPIITITSNSGALALDCNNSSISVTASGASQYAWGGGLGNTANATMSSVGTYSVVGTGANGCIDSAAITITLAPTPSVTINDTSICNGQNLILAPTFFPAGGSIIWSNALPTPTISVSPNSTTTYSVLYTWNGCTVSEDILVTVNPTPTVTVNNPTICLGDQAQITATPNLLGGTYIWSGAQTTNSISVSPVQNNTNFSVVYSLNGCVSQNATAVVTVNPIPTVNVLPITICNGQSGNLVATTNLPGGNFLWINGGETTNSITVNPTTTTTYPVLYTLNGCPSLQATGTLNVNPLPVASMLADTLSGCAPLTVSFEADTTNQQATYQWSSNSGGSGNGASSMMTFTNGGCYNVTLTATMNGCVSSATNLNYICIEALPVAEFSTSISHFSESSQSMNFINSSSGASSYVWSFGDGASSVITSPTHLFANTTSGYTIMLTAISSLGCTDSTLVTIDYQESEVYYIPNSFTPDGDKFNQVFLPIFTAGIDPYNYTMEIYNRWGEVIFETHNMEYGWDGSYGLEGNDCPSGSYTYRIVIKMPDIDERKILVGHVNLIR
jgi:gliding motility-associated-like protein